MCPLQMFLPVESSNNIYRMYSIFRMKTFSETSFMEENNNKYTCRYI